MMTTVHQGSFIEVQCYIDAVNAKYFTQLDGSLSSLGMSYARVYFSSDFCSFGSFDLDRVSGFRFQDYLMTNYK